jgi:hypothetical protein
LESIDFYLNDNNFYTGFWILDRDEFEWFTSQRYFNLNVCPYYFGYKREASAIGAIPMFNGTLLRPDISGQTVHHMPNSYLDHSFFCKISPKELYEEEQAVPTSEEPNGVDEIFKLVQIREQGGDIVEHLLTLKEYASKCDTVTELGVRGVVSTWAFIAGRPSKLTSFDITPLEYYSVDLNMIVNVASKAGVDFKFICEDVLTTQAIEETDLLFIDTLHSYKQIKMELFLHGNKAKKYLIFHDTVSFESKDEYAVPTNLMWSKDLKDYYHSLGDKYGINEGIIEFMVDNPHWKVHKVFNNNNGLLILKRN